MNEQFHDLDKQFLKRNQKLLREIQFDRAADNAISAVTNFRIEFLRSFQNLDEAEEIFRQVNIYLDGLKKVNPWRPKLKRIKK